MRTPKQIAASRINGARSRGPVTLEGRRASSQNALRHGLASAALVLANESRERFDAFFAALIEHFQPANEYEFSIVEELMAAKWRMRRLWGVETATLDYEMERHAKSVDARHPRIDETTRLSLAFSRLSDNSRALSSLSRYESRFRLAAEKAAAALERREPALPNEPGNPAQTAEIEAVIGPRDLPEAA